MKFNRRYVFGALVAAALAVSMVVSPVRTLAQNAGQFVTSLLANDAIQIYRQGTAANVYINANNLAAYTRSQSLLFSSVATSGTTATTVEQTLATYTIAANLCKSGTQFQVRSNYTTGADGNNKTMRLYFGSNVNSTGAQAANAQNGNMTFQVVCQGGNAQIITGTASVGTTSIAPYVAYGTNVVTLPIVVKFTGQNGTSQANDIILNYFSVERLGS